MYTRDEIKPVQQITREQFVEEIFEIGLINEFGYDSLIAAVQLGDQYVTGNNIYSVELVHASLVLVTKRNDDQFYTTNESLEATENKYTVLLEWELFKMVDYHIKINNFITVIGKLLPKDKKLPSIFWHISKQICLSNLLNIEPKVIVCACILLHKHNKLKAVTENKKRVFKELITKLAYNYGLEEEDILKQYIKNNEI